MLASGAHVKIDTREFVLDEAEEGHYQHSLESLLVPRQDISGKPGRQNIRPDVLLWALDDWSGGEGHRVFDPDRPHIYDTGSGNPRQPGRLSGRPPRQKTDLTVSGSSSTTLEGNTLTDSIGTSEDTGTDTRIGHDHLDETINLTLNDPGQHNGTSFVPGAKAVNCSVDYEVVVPGDIVVPDFENGTITVRFKIRNTTDNLDAAVTTYTYNNNSWGTGLVTNQRFGLRFTAIAGKTYRPEMHFVSETGNGAGTLTTKQLRHYFPLIEEVRTSDRAVGAVSITVDFYLDIYSKELTTGFALEGTNLAVDYEVEVFNQTDTLSIETKTGTTAGAKQETITFTGTAGKNYRYFVKKTSDTDGDGVVVNKIVESSGDWGLDAPMAATRSAAWVAFGAEVARTENGVTWTKRTLQTAPTAGHRAVAAAADDDFFYILFHDSPVIGTSGNWEIHRLDGSLTGANWTNTKMADPGTTIGYPCVLAMAPASRRLYLLTGKSLIEFDVTAAALWPVTTVHTFATSETAHTQAGITALDDNSIAYFHSSPGRSVVYRFKNGQPEPLWYPAEGFTARGITDQQGHLVLVGGDIATNAPGIQVRTLRMADLTPDQVKTFRDREGVATFATSVNPGPKTTVLIGDNRGRIWSYELDGGAFSQLDDTSSGNPVRSAVVFLNRRIASSGVASDTISMFTWESDLTSGVADFTTDSGVFDFDLPEASKTFLGASVALEPIPAGASVEIFYDLDSSGSWTSLGTMSTGFIEFLPAPSGASTKRFRHMALRVDGNLGTANTTPVVLSVTTHATTQDFLETWDLVLRMKKESPTERPTDRQKKAEELRDWLLDIAANKTIVPFIDGYRYQERGTTAAAVDVIVDTPRDVITRNAEGSMRVRLRRVTI